MISVIIPTYKQTGNLRTTIESVLSQTYKNVEIIVVDDNNPETKERKQTEELMREYKNNPQVVYLKHEHNKNGSAARNTGFRASRGEYIAFLDDDDYWETEKLEKQLDYLTAHSEYNAVYCYTFVRGNAKNPNQACEGNIAIQYLTNYVSLQTSCVLFTRKAVEKLNGFDESFNRHQDYEFLLRFFFAGFKIGCVPEYLSHKTTSGANNTQTGEKLNQLKEKFFATFDKQFDELEKIQPGVKTKIIVANYVKVFESHLAGKHYKLAFQIFVKYFSLSPVEFTKQCFRLWQNHKKRHETGKIIIHNDYA